MRRSSLPRSFMGLAAALRRFYRNTRGVAAIEFALIAPVMAMIYIGTAELSNALTVDRKVTHTASALADLVAQDTRVTNNEMSDILAAATAMLAPFDAGPLELVVSSVVADSQNRTRVAWSDARGGSPHSPGALIALPGGLTQPSDSVIVAEVRYTYSSPFTRFVTDGFVMEDRFYLRPRRAAAVERVN